MTKRGKIITIEGTDSSGKETQTRMLVDRLRSEKFSVASMSFPRYQTPTGRVIGQCYLGKQGLGEGDAGWFGDPDKLDPRIASLYYAADRRAAKPEIEKIISEGTNLILDRYYWSNMAHQGGKLESGKEREKLFLWLFELELKMLQIPQVDKTIFLYMPYQVARELREGRKGNPDLHELNENHLINAEQTYLALEKNYGGEDRWIRINCAPGGTIKSLRSREDIHEEVYEVAKREILG